MQPTARDHEKKAGAVSEAAVHHKEVSCESNETQTEQEEKTNTQEE